MGRVQSRGQNLTESYKNPAIGSANPFRGEGQNLYYERMNKIITNSTLKNNQSGGRRER